GDFSDRALSRTNNAFFGCVRPRARRTAGGRTDLLCDAQQPRDGTVKHTSTPNIVEFTTDPQLLNLTLSLPQETLLRGIYGLPLPTSAEQNIWQRCTGGRRYREGHEFSEVSMPCGARGGKTSRI